MKKGNKIFKYQLQITDIQSIDMPKGAKILNLQAQFDNPNIWAMVDPQIETEQRWFQMFGTGHELSNSELDYIGTFQTRGGVLVFHVFEVAPRTTQTY